MPLQPDPDRSCPTCRSFDPVFCLGPEICPDAFHDIYRFHVLEADEFGAEFDLDKIPVYLKHSCNGDCHCS